MIKRVLNLRNVLGLLWVLSLCVGLVLLQNYSSRPGDSAAAPNNLRGLKYSNEDGRDTLLVFVHPHCSCSKASLRELKRLVAFTRDRVNINIIFYRPHGKSLEWTKSDLWDLAMTIEGAELSIVRRNTLDQFDAKTSGQTMLYDIDRKLVFNGGLTSSRGHEGDNLGTSTIREYLLYQKKGASNGPVFGCALTSEHVELGA